MLILPPINCEPLDQDNLFFIAYQAISKGYCYSRLNPTVAIPFTYLVTSDTVHMLISVCLLVRKTSREKVYEISSIGLIS